MASAKLHIPTTTGRIAIGCVFLAACVAAWMVNRHTPQFQRPLSIGIAVAALGASKLAKHFSFNVNRDEFYARLEPNDRPFVLKLDAMHLAIVGLILLDASFLVLMPAFGEQVYIGLGIVNVVGFIWWAAVCRRLNKLVRQTYPDLPNFR